MGPDRRGKVLIIEPSGLMYGSERALLDLLPPLKADWDLTVCCPPGLFAEAAAGLEVAVRSSFTPYLHQQGRIAWLSTAFSLRRVVRDVHPDLVHVNQGGATRIARFAAGHRIPITIHTRLFEDYEYLRERGLAHRVGAIVCVSEAMKEEASRTLGESRLFRLYDPYKATSNSAAEASSNRTLVCVGRLGPIKGQDLLLGAVAELKKQGLQVSVKFLGAADENSGYGEEQKKRSQALGIADQVEWLGFRGNVFGDLRGAAALVVPSEKEPLGRVIFEAWDAGTIPIVWRGSGGALEVVAGSRGGAIFAYRTPASLAEAIKNVLEMPPAVRTSLVQNGREWLAENCHPVAIAGELSKIWRGCMKKGHVIRDNVE
jgi:glycosyltransferase involved in cell wall biosynthesis